VGTAHHHHGLYSSRVRCLLNADGSLDTNFGDAGVVQLDIGPLLSLDSYDDTIYSINVAANGDILLAGALADAGQDLRAVVVRLDSGGDLVSAFGYGGVLAFQVDSEDTGIRAAVLREDRLYVTGSVADGRYFLAAVYVDPNYGWGYLDSGFATGGIFAAEPPDGYVWARANAIAAAGDYLAIGGTVGTADDRQRMLAMRWDLGDGQMDWERTVSFGDGQWDWADARGVTVTAGTTWTLSRGCPSGCGPSPMRRTTSSRSRIRPGMPLSGMCTTRTGRGRRCRAGIRGSTCPRAASPPSPTRPRSSTAGTAAPTRPTPPSSSSATGSCTRIWMCGCPGTRWATPMGPTPTRPCAEMRWGVWIRRVVARNPDAAPRAVRRHW
jgi:hypothetical protein